MSTVFLPPPQNTQVYAFLSFLSELNTFIYLAATASHEFLITGDVNLSP